MPGRIGACDRDRRRGRIDLDRGLCRRRLGVRVGGADADGGRTVGRQCERAAQAAAGDLVPALAGIRAVLQMGEREARIDRGGHAQVDGAGMPACIGAADGDGWRGVALGAISKDGARRADRPAVVGIDEGAAPEHLGCIAYGRVLRGPGGAAVAGDQDRAIPADDPAVEGIDEGDALEIGADDPRVLRGPGGATIDGGEDGTAGTHTPALAGIDEADAEEILGRRGADPRVLRGPGGATIAGVQDDAIHADRPALLEVVGEVDTPQDVSRARVLRSPGGATVAGDQDCAVIAHCPAVVGIDERDPVEILSAS